MKTGTSKYQIILVLMLSAFLLSGCQALKYRPVDAKEYPPEPEKRVKKNIEEGRGFRLFEDGSLTGGSGKFEFASSNELWRASLDTISFMPLISANYSGGIIITDWYNDGNANNQSIKITIRFLSNEIRVDALDIKIFTKNCPTSTDCKITENKGNLIAEIKKSILKKAAVYEKNNKTKAKPYVSNPTNTR